MNKSLILLLVISLMISPASATFVDDVRALFMGKQLSYFYDANPVGSTGCFYNPANEVTTVRIDQQGFGGQVLFTRLDGPRAGSQGATSDNYIYAGTCANPVPTPPPTPTPAPIPAPVKVAPSFTAILNAIISWLGSILGQLSISGGNSATILINQPYTTQISLDFAPPDTNYQDGTMTSKYGEWLLLDSAKNVVSESGWSQELTTSPYTATASFTPTSAGTYFIVGVIDKQTYTYGTSGWTMTETVETKEVQQLTVSYPAIVKQRPATSNIIASIFASIKALFSWLPW